MNYGTKTVKMPLPKPKPKIGTRREAASSSPYTVKNGNMVMTGNYASDK